MLNNVEGSSCTRPNLSSCHLKRSAVKTQCGLHQSSASTSIRVFSCSLGPSMHTYTQTEHTNIYNTDKLRLHSVLHTVFKASSFRSPLKCYLFRVVWCKMVNCKHCAILDFFTVVLMETRGCDITINARFTCSNSLPFHVIVACYVTFRGF